MEVCCPSCELCLNVVIVVLKTGWNQNFTIYWFITDRIRQFLKVGKGTDVAVDPWIKFCCSCFILKELAQLWIWNKKVGKELGTRLLLMSCTENKLSIRYLTFRIMWLFPDIYPAYFLFRKLYIFFNSYKISYSINLTYKYCSYLIWQSNGSSHWRLQSATKFQ